MADQEDEQEEILNATDIQEVIEEEGRDDPMNDDDQPDEQDDQPDDICDPFDAINGFEHNDPVFAIASFSKLIASGGGDDKAFIWDVDTGDLVKELPSHQDSVISLAFSHDGKYIASGGMDGIVNVTQMETANSVKLQGPNEIIWVRWHPRGLVLIAGAEDGTIWMWSIPSGNCMQVFSGHSDSVTAGEFSPDGKSIISISADGSLIIWNPQTGSATFRFTGSDARFHQAPLTCLSLSHDNQMALTGAQDGSIKLLHLTQKKIISSFDSHTDSVEGLTFSSNLNYAISGSVDGKICIWDLTSLSCRNSIETDSAITKILWKDPHSFFSSSMNGNVTEWDVRTGQVIKTLKGHQDGVLDFIILDSLLVSGSDDGYCMVYKV